MKIMLSKNISPKSQKDIWNDKMITIFLQATPNLNPHAIKAIIGTNNERGIRVDEPQRSPSPHLIEGEVEAKLSPAM